MRALAQTGMGIRRDDVGDVPLPVTVGLAGLGLIGGSLGLDLQALGCEVRGVAHRTITADRALERGLVQSVSTDPGILQGCDLVVC